MAAKWTELVFDCTDVFRVAEFWAAVLDYEIADKGDDYVVLKGDEGPLLGFWTVPEKKTIKNRLHIDLRATDRDQMEEVERIIGLGAKRVDIGQGDDVSWVVLADPEGNEFCVLRDRA